MFGHIQHSGFLINCPWLQPLQNSCKSHLEEFGLLLMHMKGKANQQIIILLELLSFCVFASDFIWCYWTFAVFQKSDMFSTNSLAGLGWQRYWTSAKLSWRLALWSKQFHIATKIPAPHIRGEGIFLVLSSWIPAALILLQLPKSREGWMMKQK